MHAGERTDCGPSRSWIREMLLSETLRHFYRASEKSSSKKVLTTDHEIVRKIGKRADYQNEVSAIFTMRLENLCEREAWIFQIEIMGAFFGVSLNFIEESLRRSSTRRQPQQRWRGPEAGKWTKFGGRWS